MNAAVVSRFDLPPALGEFSDPEPRTGETIVAVSAAAASPLVRARASGKHYSSGQVLPFVPGVDGVGRLPDGRRVYFGFPRAPYGSIAERAPVADGLWVEIPDNLDDVRAAAIANPGMSSWAALTLRAKLRPGETVLINGATGAAGGMAIKIAKHLGAGRVIATGRDTDRLAALTDLGADATIPIVADPEAMRSGFSQALEGGVDVVIDYLWGASAEAFLAALGGRGEMDGAPRLRYVQIGTASGRTIQLPGEVLRSSGLQLLGSGLGSISHAHLVRAIGEMLQAAATLDLRVPTVTAQLRDVAIAWDGAGADRLVLLP